MTSRRTPIAARPAAKTSQGRRISRLVAVTFVFLARRIHAHERPLSPQRAVAHGG
jgi:hypothetical protein